MFICQMSIWFISVGPSDDSFPFYNGFSLLPRVVSFTTNLETVFEHTHIFPPSPFKKIPSSSFLFLASFLPYFFLLIIASCLPFSNCTFDDLKKRTRLSFQVTATLYTQLISRVSASIRHCQFYFGRKSWRQRYLYIYIHVFFYRSVKIL